MLQTITIRSDNSYEINTGSRATDQIIDSISADLSAKITSIVNSMLSDGIVEVHSEKDTWREFEHVRSASGVDVNDFGTIISSADFDWIVSTVDSIFDDIEARAANTGIGSDYVPGDPEPYAPLKTIAEGQNIVKLT